MNAGRTLLVVRLAARDVRRHLAQAALLVVAIAAATATLTMGLALSGVTSQKPYLVTRAATNGPDVVAYLTSPSQASSLTAAAGVSASSGPYPLASGVIRFNRRIADVFAEGRSTSKVGVDQPLVTSGSWVRPGGVVVERTFADALGVSVGNRVSIEGQAFIVVGIAVTAAQAPYPNLCAGTFLSEVPADDYFSNSCPQSFDIPFLSLPGGHELASSDDVGQVWLTQQDAIGLTSSTNPLNNYVLNLKLQNPNGATLFAAAHTTNQPNMSSWEGIEREDEKLVQDGHGVLQPGAFLLTMLAIASVAVLVGRRLSEYARRVGLLKAVGGTPSLVAVTFLFENLLLALSAAAVGLLVGWWASPLITNPGSALIGSAGSSPISLGSVGEVAALAIVASLAATLLPAIRASRSSAVAALSDVARPPKRRGRMIRLSSRLPIPALFGLRLVARRPRRALLTTANVAVTITGIVAVLSFHAFADDRLSRPTGVAATGLADPVINRDEQMLAVVTIMLVALAALNALFTTWATVLDARRASAMMRALGARAREVSSGLVIAQLLSALPGAILGIPLGLGLFATAVHGGGLPPVTWLAAALLGGLASMALLTLLPARLGARESLVEVLQSETG